MSEYQTSLALSFASDRSSSADGAALRDAGIARALEHADDVEPLWSEQAYLFLLEWIRDRREPFQSSEVRQAAAGIVPEPPNARAWGGVISRARRRGLIIHAGMRPHLDPSSHCTPANVWRRVL